MINELRARRPFWPLAALALVAASALGGCKSGGGGAPAGGGAGGRGRGAAVPVETTSVRRLSVQRAIDVSGTLLSQDQAKVSSEVAGRVSAVPVELGADVQPGDVLVRLDPRELQLALERAESALRQVEAQLGIERTQTEPPSDEQIASVRQALANRDDARSQYARSQALSGRGLLSKVDYDTADTRLKVMEANYQAAVDNVRALKASLQDRRAAYELAQKKLNDAVIRAPVAGSVAERLVQPGEFIRENTQVVTIVQMSPLRLRTAVQEKFAGQVKPGQAVRFGVEAYPDQTFNGSVAYVSPAVDQATRTYVIEAVVDNASRLLKPGFFAKGAIQTKLDENVMAVPDNAVSTLAGVSTVYVLENGKVRPQIVEIGVHQDGAWEVVRGLKGSETLAASNLNQLASGTSVTTGGGRGGGRGEGRAGNGGRAGATGEQQP
jgi:RND family efflux transporter MFP subunit